MPKKFKFLWFVFSSFCLQLSTKIKAKGGQGGKHEILCALKALRIFLPKSKSPYIEFLQ